MEKVTSEIQNDLGNSVSAAVQAFHQKRAKRLHVTCAALGLAAVPNRLSLGPAWLGTVVFAMALCAAAAIGVLGIRYFYLKGRPERLKLPENFLEEHETLLEQVRKASGKTDFQPKVLADLMVFATPAK